MIQFENYQVIKAPNRLKLSADIVLFFDKFGDEDFAFEAPKCWDSEFLKKINIDQFDLYFIYAKTIPHGQYNRITDYKKIWGINHLSRGEYDNSYDNKRGKVYFGVKKAKGEKAFMQKTSPMVLLLPIGNEINYDILFNGFKNSRFDFETEEGCNVLSDIQRTFAESYLLRYHLCGTVSMSIYGQNAESLFCSEDTKRWEVINQNNI